MTRSGPYVIGCDVGSQGTNAALYAADGELGRLGVRGVRPLVPAPGLGRAGPRPVDGRGGDGVPAAGRRVSRMAPSAIRGLSFGSQLDGMVVCDAAGRRLRPALIWMDRRAEAQAAALAERISPQDFYGRWARTSTRPTRCSRRSGSATRSPRCGQAAHAHVARHLRAAARDRRHRRRPLERLVAGAARPADEDVVARGAGRDRDRPGDAPRARATRRRRSGP